MQKKKGISLIVLVITIIVMIILAAAIVISLNNSNIINKANEAVDKTDEAQLKNIATLGWMEAYTNGARTVEDLPDGTKGLKSGVELALIDNNLEPEDYLLNVTTRGVNIKPIDKVWVYDKTDRFTLKRGKDVLEIGDVINYNAGVEGYTGGWKVLGADGDGNLLIMSAADVKTNHRLGFESTDTTAADKLEEAQNDWLNGAAELDGICEPYGYGEGAVGKARSITVEDVNKVTGYAPETASNGEPYGSGQLYQYGNEVTYRYSATANKTNPDYTSVVTGTTPKALSNAHTNGFYYYNEKTGEFDHITDLATGERGKEFAKLTSNSYWYHASDLTTISRTANSEAYQMIFGKSNDTYYWLASPYVTTDTHYAFFGMRYVENGDVGSYPLWLSDGDASCYGDGVRAVVTLKSDLPMSSLTE